MKTLKFQRIKFYLKISLLQKAYVLQFSGVCIQQVNCTVLLPLETFSFWRMLQMSLRIPHHWGILPWIHYPGLNLIKTVTERLAEPEMKSSELIPCHKPVMAKAASRSQGRTVHNRSSNWSHADLLPQCEAEALTALKWMCLQALHHSWVEFQPSVPAFIT